MFQSKHRPPLRKSVLAGVISYVILPAVGATIVTINLLGSSRNQHLTQLISVLKLFFELICNAQAQVWHRESIQRLQAIPRTLELLRKFSGCSDYWWLYNYTLLIMLRMKDLWCVQIFVCRRNSRAMWEINTRKTDLWCTLPSIHVRFTLRKGLSYDSRDDSIGSGGLYRLRGYMKRTLKHTILDLYQSQSTILFLWQVYTQIGILALLGLSGISVAS